MAVQIINSVDTKLPMSFPRQSRRRQKRKTNFRGYSFSAVHIPHLIMQISTLIRMKMLMREENSSGGWEY